MADDLDATLGEIAAHRAEIAPQIRGMELMLSDGKVSSEMRAQVQSARDARMHRDNLCITAIVALQALKDDNYPSSMIVQIQNSLLAEMQEENADLDAATAVFKSDQAVKMEINLGQPVTRPPA